MICGGVGIVVLMWTHNYGNFEIPTSLGDHYKYSLTLLRSGDQGKSFCRRRDVGSAKKKMKCKYHLGAILPLLVSRTYSVNK